MIDGTTKTGRTIATVAVFTAAACGMAMNFEFSRSLGVTDVEKTILSVFGLSVDVVKLMALSAATFAWSKGYRIKASSMSIVWGGCVVYGLLAALGFVAVTRDASMQARFEAAKPIKAQILEARANGRLYEALNQSIEQAKHEKRYQDTVGCLDATAKFSVLFCQNYKESIAKINELSKLPKIMTDQEADQQIKVTITADPQIAIISKITGLDEEGIMFAIVIFVACLAELITSLGVYGFSRSIKKPEAKAEAANSSRKLRVVNN